MTSPVRPLRSRLLLPETLPFTDARERRWFYNYRGAGGPDSVKLLPDLIFWGQAEHVTADGSGNVSALADLSGAGVIASAVQATAANQPTLVADGINGRPVIRFNGTSHRLEADALATSFTGDDSPFTVIAVAKLASLVAAGAILGYGSSLTDTPFGYVGFYPTTNRWFTTRRDDAGAFISLGPNGTADTNATVVSWIFTGAAMTMRAGGVTLFAFALDVGALTLDQVTIGGRRETTANTFWNGDVAEIAICAGALSADQCLAAERAMARRSGLVVA